MATTQKQQQPHTDEDAATQSSPKHNEHQSYSLMSCITHKQNLLPTQSYTSLNFVFKDLLITPSQQHPPCSCPAFPTPSQVSHGANTRKGKKEIDGNITRKKLCSRNILKGLWSLWCLMAAAEELGCTEPP